MNVITRNDIVRENISIAKMVRKEMSKAEKDGFIELIFCLTENEHVFADLSQTEIEAICKEVFSND